MAKVSVRRRDHLIALGLVKRRKKKATTPAEPGAETTPAPQGAGAVTAATPAPQGAGAVTATPAPQGAGAVTAAPVNGAA